MKVEADNSVAYNGTTFAGSPELLSGVDHEIDLRGMRTMDEVDAAIQDFYAPGRSPR